MLYLFISDPLPIINHFHLHNIITDSIIFQRISIILFRWKYYPFWKLILLNKFNRRLKFLKRILLRIIKRILSILFSNSTLWITILFSQLLTTLHQTLIIKNMFMITHVPVISVFLLLIHLIKFL
jgi:hypothetical protein